MTIHYANGNDKAVEILSGGAVSGNSDKYLPSFAQAFKGKHTKQIKRHGIHDSELTAI